MDTNIQKLMSFMLGITKYEKKLFDLMIFFLKEKAYTCERGRQTFGVENSTIYKFKNI